MTEIVALAPLSASPPGESFAERHGGILVSLSFHAMLLALLFSQVTPAPEPPEPPSTIQLSLAPLPPAPDDLVAPPLVREAARASNIGEEGPRAQSAEDPSEDPREEEAPSGAPEAADAPPAASEQPDAPPDPEREAPPLLSEITRRLMEEQTREAAAQIRDQIRAHERIRGQLFAEREKLTTRNADFVAAGALAGAVREIDFSGVPIEIIEQVLARYNASIERRFLTEEEIRNEGPIVISAARFGDQILTAHRGGPTGRYLAFSYGPELAAHLEEVEFNAVAHAGISLNDVAITRVVFALEPVYSGWDFRVRDIEFHPVQE